MHTAVRRGGLLISRAPGAYSGKGRAQSRSINGVRAFATGAAPAYQIVARLGGCRDGDLRDGHAGGSALRGVELDINSGERFVAASESSRFCGNGAAAG